MDFVNEIKNSFKLKNNFNILIYINLIVFIAILITNAVLFLLGIKSFEIIEFLAVPADTLTLSYKPWTIITYMFTHENFIHILINLLVFYWFGKLFLQYLSQRQLFCIYLMGGIAGAAFYVLAFNTIPAFAFVKYFSVALGASASVMAIVIAVATLVPNQDVYMFFIGRVKLKYLAIGIVIIDLISIPVDNAGGHIAHLGGAFLGFIFVYYYKKGTDITIWLSRFLYGIKDFFSTDKEIKVKYRNPNKKSNAPETDMEYNARKKAEQDEIDAILDKIAKSGYGSLSATEKERLFKASNKNKG